MDELLDVVNENDKAIGKARYSECHKKGLLHRGVHVLFFKDRDYQEILIQKRSLDVTYPGKFTFPGGHVRKGQSYLEAIEMEVQEEVFNNKKIPDSLKFEPLFKVRKIEPKCDALVQVYRAVYSGRIFHNHEVVLNRWVNIETLVFDVKNNPDDYDYTVRFLLGEYVKRIVKNGGKLFIDS
ncbi:MAG: NUDIX domain-containing protein [Candidatus Nanoarchaeia archaeon]|nr:NUDIX domain-containing protein [Candidatus Nanoarchaeia archaeon]